MYEKMLYAGWGDMDFNAHMGNTGYLDKAADLRLHYFAEHGFPVAEFRRLRIGPVIMKETLEYFKEVGLMEPIKVTLGYDGLSEDGSRFEICNEFYLEDGRLAARVTSLGGWLDLAARKLVAPPEALLQVINILSADGGVQSPRTQASNNRKFLRIDKI